MSLLFLTCGSLKEYAGFQQQHLVLRRWICAVVYASKGLKYQLWTTRLVMTVHGVHVSCHPSRLSFFQPHVSPCQAATAAAAFCIMIIPSDCLQCHLVFHQAQLSLAPAQTAAAAAAAFCVRYRHCLMMNTMPWLLHIADDHRGVFLRS